jgi:hypothetical protein
MENGLCPTHRKYYWSGYYCTIIPAVTVIIGIMSSNQ